MGRVLEPWSRCLPRPPRVLCGAGRRAVRHARPLHEQGSGPLRSGHWPRRQDRGGRLGRRSGGHLRCVSRPARLWSRGATPSRTARCSSTWARSWSSSAASSSRRAARASPGLATSRRGRSGRAGSSRRGPTSFGQRAARWSRRLSERHSSLAHPWDGNSQFTELSAQPRRLK